MNALDDLKLVLENEIKKVAAKGEVSPTEIKPLGEVVDILKDIETICAMKEYGNDDSSYAMSNRGYSSARYSSRPDWDNRGMYYDDGNSYKRDSMGRYSRDNYSGHNSEKDEMIYKLEQMMNSAKSEKDRMMYIDAIEALKRN